MKTTKILRFGYLLMAFMPFSALTVAAETATLRVEVDQLRNVAGVLQVAIYNQDGTIPDETYQKYYRIKTSEITDNSATVVFDNLPHGTYAINIVHDENQNGQVDKGFILPKEGIGFSNYTQIGLSNRPNFKGASFSLSRDLTKQVTVIYF